jgi:hypothetical protein
MTARPLSDVTPPDDSSGRRQWLLARLKWLKTGHPAAFEMLVSKWPSLATVEPAVNLSGSLDALASALAHVEAVAGVPFPDVEPANPVEPAN